jgi:hypothetical protein
MKGKQRAVTPPAIKVEVREGTTSIDLEEWVRRYVALVIELDREGRLAEAA